MPKAFFTDGHAFYCMFRSKTQGGVYLVMVEEKVDKEKKKLCVTHSCPAIRVHGKCHHVEKSVNAYYSWRWWEERVSEIAIKVKYISLDSNWQQIVFPDELTDIEFNEIGGVPDVARHTGSGKET